MMRRLAVILVVLISFQAHGQRDHTDFFDEHGARVDVVDSAYYFETWGHTNGKAYVVSNYLKPLALRFKSSEILPSGEHLRTYYYPNGKMKAIGKFDDLSPIGQAKSFYKSGVLMGEIEFIPVVYPKDEAVKKPSIRILNYWDSLGNQVVKNGNGICDCDLYPFSIEPEVAHGEIKDFLKEGVWTGVSFRGKMTYEENYLQGILTDGKSNYEGITYQYTEIEKSAAPRNGMKELYRHVGATIKYPRNARRLGLQGIVYVGFIINDDGSLTGLHIVEGFGDAECNDEAMKAIRSAGPWQPGIHRGRKVRQRYTLPIIFKLS